MFDDVLKVINTHSISRLIPNQGQLQLYTTNA